MSCPVCEHELYTPAGLVYGDARHFHCRRCGHFTISGSALEDLPTRLARDREAWAKISHAFRTSSDAREHGTFTSDMLDRIVERDLPRPKEQADLLIRWLAANTSGPGETAEIRPDSHGAVMGAKSPAGVALVFNHLLAADLVRGPRMIDDGGQPAAASLSFKGWEYFETLEHGRVAYRRAFMAMKFGEPDVEQMLGVFRDAARSAGFELKKLDDTPTAGLIDNRLRVEIQSADFVIADLSHDNPGAYWEAGYAEGLGKPVIYTCEHGKFEATKTHFDTNHHLTIVWNATEPGRAGDALKATIRATLPDLAKLQDPE